MREHLSQGLPINRNLWPPQITQGSLDCSQSPIYPLDRRCRSLSLTGPPSWSLDVSETGESTKCPWVGVVEGTAGEKNRETVTASLCLMFNGCGRVLAPPQIKSINNFLSWRKNLSDRENMISITCGFETFLNSRSSSERTLLTKSTQCSY